jgi:hypothetical protein
MVAQFLRQIGPLTVLGIWLIGDVAEAQMCHVRAPRYDLQEDIVSWSMTIGTGRSCARGVRFANVLFVDLKLASPPRFGEATLHGSGFVYSPSADFHGRDAFTLVVVGVVNALPGSSTIQVTVSDGSSSETPADTAPPSIAFASPSEGATISGSVALAATAFDDVGVANVRFFLAGKKIGSAVTAPPYATVWDSTTVADGFYTLTVVAQDTSGNTENSWIHVTVKNH